MLTSVPPIREDLTLWRTSNYTLPRLRSEAERHKDINNSEEINWQRNKSMAK